VNSIDLKVVKALVVEIIRVLWDRGLYRDNKWLRMCHDNWIGFWIDWRADKTIRRVDQQAREMTPEPEVVKPIYWGEEEGETPLGGPLGYTYQFNDGPSGTDSVQRAE